MKKNYLLSFFLHEHKASRAGKLMGAAQGVST